MNSSPWKLARTSLRPVQPGILHQNWSLRILGNWVIWILVIALSIGILPLLQVLKARTTRLRESYVLLHVFTTEYELDDFEATLRSQYSITANTTRRLLTSPSNKVPTKIIPFPEWNPQRNVWEVKRLQETLLFVKMKVANITYYLELDFRGQLIWINCKWTPKDKRGKWAKWKEKFKPPQLHGPNGLHVVVNDTWCKTEICKQVYTKENVPASCINGICQFNAPYGKNESLEALLTFANVSLSNNSVPIDEKYKLLPMIFGCVYKRRSITTGKRMKYKHKLQTDGVLGLNRESLSFPSQLHKRILAEHSIVLCLNKRKAYQAGYIAFGFPLRELGKKHPWTRLSENKGAYEVPLLNIKYGGISVLDYKENLELEPFYLTVDGSYRFTYLENKIFTPFVNIVKKWANQHGFDLQIIEGEEGTCWSFWKTTVEDAELIKAFANVTLMFKPDALGREGDVFPMRMFIKPENFLIAEAEGLVCLAIRSSDDIQQPGANILGGMAMKEHMILLDQMTERFWWIEDTDCNVHRLGELRPKKPVKQSWQM